MEMMARIAASILVKDQQKRLMHVLLILNVVKALVLMENANAILGSSTIARNWNEVFSWPFAKGKVTCTELHLTYRSCPKRGPGN